MERFERGSEWRKWDLHLHTKSSYDYKYKGEDADELLCKALKENDISAVAITDHFIIDKERIENLRKLAPDIVFFPGVELRCDKGTYNLHIILIFDYNTDLTILSNDFDAIMIRGKAKSSDNLDKIYWDFSDIKNFAETHKGIISVHAGKKSNGVDDMITNALPVAQAIKEEIANNINFFEMGKIEDIAEYNEIVFKDIEEKPMIICSDNHDPRNYILKENLWIKSDITFDGLVQCIYQPQERVFVGIKPPKIDKIDKNASTYIDSISVKRVENPKNKLEEWFNINLLLNPGLITIIGNKGSGKSALSDIIGLGCNSKNMMEASFLNEDRFRKKPKNLANDYSGEIKWKDQHIDRIESLGYNPDKEYTLENAQYLPQKFIEKICNDLDNEFQEEINKVIFSYVDNVDRGNAKNLQQLIDYKSINIKSKIDELQMLLREINRVIIRDEELITKAYKKEVKGNLLKRQKDLERLNKNKPKEVKKPENQQNQEYIDELKRITDEITNIDNEIFEAEKELKELNMYTQKISNINYNFDNIKEKVFELNTIMSEMAEEYNFNKEEFKIKIEFPTNILNLKSQEINTKIKQLQEKLSSATEDNNKSLILKKEKLEKQKIDLISQTDSEEKKYQKYLQDLDEWNENKLEIIGNVDIENSIEGLKNELEYIEVKLSNDYEEHKQKRLELIEEIFNRKKEIVKIYTDIYYPIDKEIKRILLDVDDKINFSTDMTIKDKEVPERILTYVSKSYNGIFSGKADSINVMNELIKDKDFNKLDDVKKFVNSVFECVYEDIDNSSKKIKNKEEFYQLVSNLDYIDIEYSLKVGDRTLQELSPGERGIVLLIFYLALSKDDIPIIIDQPEDNLDNQSVYDKLVPCICEAKKKRQVIIVTHNPNIAIACDAEQIIYCSIDKNDNKISYISGGIENKYIRDKVIDVLEGTMPAFNLRKRKYS